MQNLVVSLRAIAVFTVLTGLLYPLTLTVFAGIVFPFEAGGSLIEQNGQVIGSALIAQKTENPAYFTPRPSAADYATVASGASNLSPASAKFVQAVEERRNKLGPPAPADALTESGSGLDPHISPENAWFQLARVAQARGLSPEQSAELRGIVKNHIEAKTFGILGQERVNVLLLNVAIDERYPKR